MVIKLIKNKKTILVSIAVIVIIIIAVIIFLSQNNKNLDLDEENIDLEKLEIGFNDLFDNQENQYIKTLYDIEDEKSGKYKIDVNIPYLKVEDEIDNKVNKEIYDVFINKILQIINKGENYTLLNVDYGTAVNENILSLTIKCILKEGRNAQRTIIKTYNYDIEEQKEINIMDIIPKEKTEELQYKINQEIEKQIKKEELIMQQGYNIYKRDKESDIYILENASEFYIRENILYIIYSYGNSNYTSEVDLIITKI